MTAPPNRRRCVWIPDDIWRKIEKNLSGALSVSEWIRQACVERLGRIAGEGR